ncbi:MAG TPA: hypothetical protein VKB93_09925 [Thermoanaerobaculia bacterium]|nr:hypothetical protein [Thermoanaerobaculia bacterium]
MGFFGVLYLGDQADVVVSACHLNLISLDGLFGRRVLLLDVGLRIRAVTGSKPKAVTIVLPCMSKNEQLHDLSAALRDDRLRTLIFARAVPLVGDTMTLHSESVTLLPIDVHASKNEHNEANFSQWRVVFADALSDTQDAYVRLRFRLRAATTVWEWQRSAFVRNRAIVDFRVADARGVTSVPNRDALVRRILSVEVLNLFVIAPMWLRMRFASPNLEYTRLFEGAVWEDYLGRAAGDKLVVYQWEQRKVGADKPYRAFLELGREPEAVSLGNHARAAVVTVIALLLVSFLLDRFAAFLPGLTRIAKWLAVAVGSAITLSIVLRLLSLTKLARDVWRWAVQKFEKLEEAYYRRLRK